MKIALITDGIYPYVIGGMQRHSFYLAKFLAQQKVYVELYHFIPANYAGPEPDFSPEEKEYIQLIETPYPARQRFPGHYLYERYEYSKRVYAKLVTKVRPDWIYIKGFAGWHVLKKWRNSGIPMGVNFHGYEMFQKTSSLGMKVQLGLLRWAVKRINALEPFLFSYGGKITDIIRQLHVKEERIIEIPTGIESNWLATDVHFPGDRIRFVFVGRYERRKGLVELTSALRQTIAAGYKLEFHFIGPIPPEHQLKEHGIIYHGAIFENDKMKQILSHSDVLVCPSYAEGMPNVIMEGMASGLAIVATNVGAVGLMVDNDNGWLLGNDIEKELTDRFKTILRLDKDQLLKMKRSSVEKVRERFLWENVIKLLLVKLNSIISEKR